MSKQKNSFLFMSILCICFISLAQSDTRIIWGTKKLAWADFTGPIVKNHKDDVAVTSSSIDLDYKYITRDSLILILTCRFSIDKSWTITDDSWVLNHEQKHFDLTEIYARKTRKEYLEKTLRGSMLNSEIQKIFKKWSEESAYQQKLYDKQTEHSKNKPQQILWDSKIETELKRLESYTSTIIPLKVNWQK